MADALLPRSGRADDQDYPLGGETLGLWRLVKGIGRGGMGEVYEAEYDYIHLLSLRYAPDQRDLIKRELAALDRVEQARLATEMLGTPLPPEARFAIKICNARTGTAGHKRFLQEAEVAQRLGDHPYIVSVHAINGGGLVDRGSTGRFALERGKYRDVAFMVMDLAVRDYDHTKLAIAEAVNVVRCIATALDHAHANGVIHRDLKPENILGSVHHPLLTDFGIAKELDHSHGLTRTGQIIGTLDYMSPEQATDAKRVDHRSDIYSLGVVLYETATQGCLPYFHKADRESCLAAIRSQTVEPKWPREYVKDFPIGLERIVLKAMSHRMEDRYQAMSEFIGDLDRFTRGEWIPFWGRVRVRGWARYQLRRHPRLIWGGVAAAAAAVALVVALMLPVWFDENRREIRDRLDHYEQVVALVEAGRSSQPSRDDLDKIKQLDQQLRGVGDRYPDLRERKDALRRRLDASRWIDARFVAGRWPDGRDVSASDTTAARERLQVAAGLQSPDWSVQGEGLHLQETTKLRLGPYGTGAVRVALRARVSDGFALVVHEAEKPVRHQLHVRVRGGVVQQIYQEDEKPAVVLYQEPLAADGVIAIQFELSEDAVRCRQPREQAHRLRGLNERAPAQVEIDLPRESVLHQLEVRPLPAGGG